MTRDELGQRLGVRIADGFCWVSEEVIEIFEDSAEGEARVTCALPPGGVGLIFRLDRVGFPFLRQRSAVDWLLLVHLPDGSVDAHLVECKRTVNSFKWREIKGQMESSVTRTRALAGALGVEVREVHCYTAFRFDRLSELATPAAALTRLLIGSEEVARVEPADSRTGRLKQLDWEAPKISIDGVDTPVSHRRIQLDPTTGVGQMVLFSH